MKQPRRWKQQALSFLLAVGFLAVFLRRVDLGAVVDQILVVRPGYLVCALAGFMATVAYRGIRWADLMRTERRIAYRDAVECTFMAWTVTALLPGRLGELARPILLARRATVRRSTALGAIALERALDLAVILAMLSLYVAIFFEPAAASPDTVVVVGALRAGSWLVLVGLVLLAVAIVLLRRGSPGMSRLAHRLARWLLPGVVRGRVSSSGRTFLAGLAGPRGKGGMLLAVAHTAMLWGLVCTCHWLLFAAFRMPLPPWAVFPLLVLVILGSLVPTPAAVGSYHAAVQFALSELLGQSVAVASGYAITSHALVYLPSAALGAWLLAREGLSAFSAGALSGAPEEAETDFV